MHEWCDLPSDIFATTMQYTGMRKHCNIKAIGRVCKRWRSLIITDERIVTKNRWIEARIFGPGPFKLEGDALHHYVAMVGYYQRKMQKYTKEADTLRKAMHYIHFDHLLPGDLFKCQCGQPPGSNDPEFMRSEFNKHYKWDHIAAMYAHCKTSWDRAIVILERQ